MASVPSIPPLLCSTPPPIEFCENDDDSGLSPTLTLEDDEDVFGEYTSRNERLTPDVASLPRTPLQNELSSSTTSGFTEVPPTIFDDQLAINLMAKEEIEVKVPVVEAYNYTIESQHNNVEKNQEEEEEEFKSVNTFEVILEDIPDDSDNELYAPCPEAFDETLDGNSKEFYQIHMIDEIRKKEEHNVALDDNDDFAEFSTFERAVEDVEIENVNILKETESSEFTFEADFSAFSTTNERKDEAIITNYSPNIEENKISNEVVCNNPVVDEFYDDDDEFGDFAEAVVVVPAVESNLQTQSTPVVNLSNLNERLQTILQTAFPIDIDINAGTDATNQESTSLKRLNVQQKIELPSIDAAKALDYQWAGSQMRHALIKSIGIDYRNMLFGEQWNPSMPRFAANLSCNPLQPLKPQNVSQHANDNVAGKQLTDVPAVEFDWNSAGLVNPLDGSKEVLQSREAEKLTTLQLQTDDDTTEQKQQVQIESNIHNIDTTTTLSTDNNNLNTNNYQQQWETEQSLNDNEDLPTVWSEEHDLPNVQDLEIEDEVVTTSTYAGPLKETHIYTPPRGSETSLPRTVRAGYMTTPTTPINLRVDPIDFDYEKAAAGIIIDETVVKKEYRDVEYNPDFGNNTIPVANALTNVTNACDDDFSEFQSVPPKLTNVNKPIILNSPVLPAKQNTTRSTSRTATPTMADQMILSPAILLPQAVSMNNNNNNNLNNENNLKTKIEWGDTVSNINPEELARIEELFPQSKSQKSTPTHQAAVHNSPLTISATIAQKEQIGLDDDEWSDFVSVTIPKSTPTNTTFPNKLKQQQHMLNSNNNNNNDDDWSDFVSNTTSASATSSQARTQIPSGVQFNSGAWQNANFYNNPLSFYHQSQQHQQTPVPSMHKVQNNNNFNRNNHNNNNNNNFLPQQIHIMQDFSTAPPNMQQYQRQQQHQSINNNNNNNNNQYQVGSAKVAPSISLIPDLGFVAPAMPTHTAYVNALPKSTFTMKK